MQVSAAVVAAVVARFWCLFPSSKRSSVVFVLVHTGGAAAAFDPMSEHLQAFDWALGQYMGAGVAACYRGFRIFNDDASMLIVKKWVRGMQVWRADSALLQSGYAHSRWQVSFYKKYRPILISDIIHIVRDSALFVSFGPVCFDCFPCLSHQLNSCCRCRRYVCIHPASCGRPRRGCLHARQPFHRAPRVGHGLQPHHRDHGRGPGASAVLHRHHGARGRCDRGTERPAVCFGA